MNETLHGANNSTALSSVTFGFPASYQAHLVALSSYAEIGSNKIQAAASTSVSNNILLITVTFGQSLGGTNSTVGLGFWVLDALTAVNSSGYYTGPLLYSPSININLTSMYSEVNLPYLTTYAADTTFMQKEGYAQTISSNSELQTWNFTTTTPNSTLLAFTTSIYSNPTTSGALDFTSIIRQISVDASGQITVEDTLNVRNLGLNTISALTYTPLTNLANLTAVPSKEPPLSNVGLVKMSGGQVQLNATNQAIQPDSSATLIFQYPLSNQYWKVSNGVYTLTLPTTVPIGGIADQYRLYSTSVPGVIITGQQLSLTCFWDKSNWIGNGIAQIQSGFSFSDVGCAADSRNFVCWSFHRRNPV